VRAEVERMSMATQAHSVVASIEMQAWVSKPVRERPGEAMPDAFGSILE
jgi:hypothetical protein